MLILLLVSWSYYWYLPVVPYILFVGAQTCLSTEHMCTEDGSCIDKSRLCDAFPDCDKGSDELTCGQLKILLSFKKRIHHVFRICGTNNYLLMNVISSY